MVNVTKDAEELDDSSRYWRIKFLDNYTKNEYGINSTSFFNTRHFMWKTSFFNTKLFTWKTSFIKRKKIQPT